MVSTMTSKTISSTTIHTSTAFKLVAERAALPDGTTAEMDVIRTPGVILSPLIEKVFLPSGIFRDINVSSK